MIDVERSLNSRNYFRIYKITGRRPRLGPRATASHTGQFVGVEVPRRLGDQPQTGRRVSGDSARREDKIIRGERQERKNASSPIAEAKGELESPSLIPRG